MMPARKVATGMPLHTVDTDQRAKDGRHRAGRAGNLIIAAGQRRDDQTRNDRRNQTAGRRCARRNAERKRQRQVRPPQRSGRPSDPATAFCRYNRKLPPELLEKAHSHFYSPYIYILDTKKFRFSLPEPSEQPLSPPNRRPAFATFADFTPRPRLAPSSPFKTDLSP